MIFCFQPQIVYFTKFQISNSVVGSYSSSPGLAILVSNFELPNHFRLRDTTIFVIFSIFFLENMNFKVFTKFDAPNPVLGAVRVLSGWSILLTNMAAQIFVVFEI